MKKFILFAAIIFFGLSANADGIKLTGEVAFDWVDMTQIQRDATIEHYRDVLFGKEGIAQYSKDDFKQKFAKYNRDPDYKENYRKAKMGQTETEDANLCAFFYKKDILVIYAIQYKNNPKNVFYYNAYGYLQYVDDISDDYPNYPYNSKQYRKNGKLVSAIYFISPDMQYMYKPNREFKGLWYKEKMYDANGKQTVERTNWGI